MKILEIASTNSITNFTNYAPFVYSSILTNYTLADYWVTTFGANNESNNDIIFVSGFSRGAFDPYNETSSLIDCVATEKSFFWDNENQTIYVHFEHDQSPDSDVYSYETLFGYTDSELIYIDNQEYLPLLTTPQSIRQQQDLVNYVKLSFVNGAFVLNNNGGELDFFKDLDLYGNTIRNSYIDDDDIIETSPGVFEASRSDIQRQQTFYNEDNKHNISDITFRAQDIRKAQNAEILLNDFDSTTYPDIGEDFEGDPVPLAYGPIREMKAIPVDENSGNSYITFKAAEEMSDFGLVQVDIDGVWTTKTKQSESLSTGEFTLLSSDAEDASGAVRACRLVNCTGIIISKASDVITDLNNRILGLGFNSSFYDVDEWTDEAEQLKIIGIVFDKRIKLFQAIEYIQNGANIGFRYEINSEGKRTIRIDDDTRLVCCILNNSNISKFDLPVDTDSDLVYSRVRVNYAPSFNSGKYLSVLNNDFEEEVGNKYKQKSTLTRNEGNGTYLTTKADAEERALLDATTFKDIPDIVTIKISTPTKQDRLDFLHLRIFDVILTELTPAEFVDIDNDIITGREYYGIQFIKVLSIAPNEANLENVITGKILYGYQVVLLGTEDGKTLATESGVALAAEI